MKLDVLGFAAHPDDIELACSGTFKKLQEQGFKTGIVDLTEGEMGTRGSVAERYEESAASAEILQLSARENLNLGDVWFQNDQASVLAVVRMIRKYRPRLIFANAIHDRHPDHGKAAALVQKAHFISGLAKVETEIDGQLQAPHRADDLFHYIQYEYIVPDVIVDVTTQWVDRMKSMMAYKSQFFNPDAPESNTLISSKKFIDYIDSRGREFGGAIKVEYGEGFTHSTPVNYDFGDLLRKK